jgi:hypothetical protein
VTVIQDALTGSPQNVESVKAMRDILDRGKLNGASWTLPTVVDADCAGRTVRISRSDSV